MPSSVTMAARKRTTRRTAKTTPTWLESLRGCQWLPQGVTSRRALFVGGALLAALSLIALAAPNNWGPLSWWGRTLLHAFGWGTYLLPILLGLALYTLARGRVLLQPIQWAGLLLALFTALMLTQLLDRLPPRPTLAEATPIGGGWLGWVLANGANAALGRLGALSLGVIMAVVTVLFLTGRHLSELVPWAKRIAGDFALRRDRIQREREDAARRQRAESRARRPHLQPQPAIVVPEPEPEPRRRPIIREAVAPAPDDDPFSTIAAPPAADGRWPLPDASAIFKPEELELISEEQILARSELIEHTLLSLGAPGQVVQVQRGPVLTSFGVQPGYLQYGTGDQARRRRVSVAQIMALEKDLALALSATSVRIPGPSAGSSLLPIEVPNRGKQIVTLGGILSSPEFQAQRSPLAIALGRSITGKPLIVDLATLPHLLIAGATGSGKSVAINSLITCLLIRNTPEALRLVLIDPKRVEMAGYRDLPHLIGEVVSEAKHAVAAIKWAGREMDRRYAAFHAAGVRDLASYNERVVADGDRPLPMIVLIIDELSDLMMEAGFEIEPALARVAQMSRATGIHLVIATQRPSVDVITGLIKANFPARLAFAVASLTDSRVILDAPGADRLLGKGDMLFASPSARRPIRAQGSWASDAEINAVVKHWKRLAKTMPDSDQYHQGVLWDDAANEPDPEVEILEQAIAVVEREGRASTTMLQRHLRIGYNRASTLMDRLIERGIVSREVDGPFGSHSLVEVVAEGDPSED